MFFKEKLSFAFNAQIRIFFNSIYAEDVITNWAKNLRPLLGLKNLCYSRVLLGSLAEVVRGLIGLSVLCSDIDGSCIFLCFVVVWTETREKERYLQIHLHHSIRILFLLPSNNIWRLKDRWCLNTTPFCAHFFVFNGFAVNCIIYIGYITQEKSIFEFS